MKKALLSWSSGKDSAWCLEALRGSGIQIAGLLTTINEAADRVAMHAVRKTLLQAQSDSLGIPLHTIPLPWPCDNATYESLMARACADAVAAGVQAIVFGDLFLRDIRAYRERMLAGTGLEPVFPLWDLPTADLAEQMIAGGLRARITCIDREKLSDDFAGREFDRTLLRDLPQGVDPCAENGEFHTFAYDGPMFRTPIAITQGDLREDGRFLYTDFQLCRASSH